MRTVLRVKRRIWVIDGTGQAHFVASASIGTATTICGAFLVGVSLRDYREPKLASQECRGCTDKEAG